MEKKVRVLGYVRPTTDKPHQNQEVMFKGGMAMTIKATSYKDPPKTLKGWKRKS